MGDKMRESFDATIERCGDAEKFIGNLQLKTGCLAYFIHGWQAALSQSEPQVSQPVYAYDVPIEGDAGSTELAYAAWYRRNPLPDNAIPLFTSQPDYEALKLRVAELANKGRARDLSISDYSDIEYVQAYFEAHFEDFDVVVAENVRLQSEYDRSTQRVLELEGVARDSLSALIYHSGQTRPIERTEENIKAIRKTLWEN